MKVFSVTTPLNYDLWGRGIDGWHYQMFHGAYDFRRCYDDNGLPTDAIRIYKNIFRLAPIFKPSLQWVVRADVVESLPWMRSARFLDVEFVRTFSLPWILGDFSYRQKLPEADYRSIRDWIMTQEESTNVVVPAYREMYFEDVESADPDCTADVIVNVDYFSSVRFNSTHLTKNGALSYNATTLLNEQSFTEVSKYLDDDFFVVHECNSVPLRGGPRAG